MVTRIEGKTLANVSIQLICCYREDVSLDNNKQQFDVMLPCSEQAIMH